MGGKQSRRADERRAAQRAHQGAGPGGLERRQATVEQFRLEQIDTIEYTPAEDDVDVAQLALVMVGIPALLSGSGRKTYMTSLAPELGLQLGEAIIESCRRLAEAPTITATDSGVLVAGSSDVAAAARAASATDAMRAPS